MTSQSFFQDGPRRTNPFRDDPLLGPWLRTKLPGKGCEPVLEDLDRFGERLVHEIDAMGGDANANEPRLVSYDPWGVRVDDIEVSHGWTQLARVSAEEGLIALGYDAAAGPAARLHQFAKLYLFNPYSAIFTCPLAMTDGAAKLLQGHDHPRLKRAVSRLTSRDPDLSWTSGQWMTERSGGSDVSRTETIARPLVPEGDNHLLYGTKWFTSATTSQMAMTLARIENTRGQTLAGSRGLSLFYIETRGGDGRLNNIRIHRLKDKLGTRALPTAELTLEGTRGLLVGEPGRGIPDISVLMNLTRLHNATTATSLLRHGLSLATDYAHRRMAFGRPLIDHRLHVETLAALALEWHGAFHLLFHCVELLGREEHGLESPEDRAVLRLLTPLVKLSTARQAVSGISEILECFGGAGYIEDTGLPRMLRDAQVLPIWEGTTNVLSLDALRAIQRAHALDPFIASITRRLEGITDSDLLPGVERVRIATTRLGSHLDLAHACTAESAQATARTYAFSLTRTYTASLLLDHAQKSGNGTAHIAARRWCNRELTPLTVPDDAHLSDSLALTLGTA